MAANFTKRRAATKTDPTAETLVVRKNVAPASRRHVGLDNSFRVNRTFCRRAHASSVLSVSNSPHAGCVRSPENPEESFAGSQGFSA
ncbi:MAG: hypothetical protein DMG09_14360 [Acidobacteria bacterium]|nr:MAG: hypothetical protein DMG09_14360 [Acidobacteriota bacterium]